MRSLLNGSFPSNWQTKHISDLVFYQEGPGVRKSQFTKEGVKLLNVGNINDNKINLNKTSLYVSEEEAYGKYKHFLVDEGDLLIACSGIAVDNFNNKIAFVNNNDLPLCMNTSTMRFKSHDPKKLDIRFFYRYLQTNFFKDQLRKLITGSAQLNFGPSHIKRIQIPLPPLQEQKRIAQILDKADALLQKNKQLLASYDELLQAIFLDIFGDPVINTRGWEKRSANGFIDLLTGYPFKSDAYSENQNDIKLCGGLIIMPWGIEWNKSKLWRTDKTSGLEKYWLKKDDIVMAMDRPWISSGFKIAKITNNDLPALLVQRTALIRAKNMNQTFLYFLYKNEGFARHANLTETTVPHISPKDIKSYDLIIPPITLQNQFAQIVENIEVQKILLKQSMQESEDLFNGLVQKGFKGEL